MNTQPAFAIRSCTPDWFPSVVDCINQVFLRDRGREGYSLSECTPALFDPANYANLRFIADGDIVVAHVGSKICELKISDGRTIKAGLVGSVCCRKEYRGRGYPTALMRDAIELQRRQGAALSILWSGSPDFYRRVGYEFGGRQYNLVFKPAAYSTRHAGKWRTSGFSPREILSLADADSNLRGRRTLHDQELALMKRECKYAVLEENGTPRGYCAWSGDETKYRVLDWAGAEGFYAEALDYLFGMGAAEVCASVPPEHDAIEVAKAYPENSECGFTQIAEMRVLDYNVFSEYLDADCPRPADDDPPETHRALVTRIFDAEDNARPRINFFVPLLDSV